MNLKFACAVSGRIANGRMPTVPVKPYKIELNAPLASFTFDDFAISSWTVGGRMVEDFDAKATYYVCGGVCNTAWEGVPRFSEEHLAAVVASGHDVGCHTFDHYSLPDVSNAAIEESINKNAAFLRSVIGNQKITSFAYPYGRMSLRTRRVVGGRFPACRGVCPGVNSGYSDLSQLNGICLDHTELNYDGYIEQCLRQRGWLIFVGHDVSENPGPFGCTPQFLESVLKRVSKVGIKIQTVDAALRNILGQDERQQVGASQCDDQLVASL